MDIPVTAKGEARRARKAARITKQTSPYQRQINNLDRDQTQSVEFTESARGRRALDRWARRCYEYDRD